MAKKDGNRISELRGCSTEVLLAKRKRAKKARRFGIGAAIFWAAISMYEMIVKDPLGGYSSAIAALMTVCVLREEATTSFIDLVLSERPEFEQK